LSSSLASSSLKCLEWDKLLVYLAREAQTEAGRRQALELDPFLTDAGDAALAKGLDLTQEAAALIENKAKPDLSKVRDLQDALSILRAGGSLGAADLVSIRDLIFASRQVKSSFKLLGASEFPLLTDFIPYLVTMENEHKALDDALEQASSGDDTGSQALIKDSASQLLYSLRRERQKISARIDAELARIIQSPSMAKVLQEPLFTVRNGRYVVPVVAAMRSSISGIVHDASASGQTIYIEPLAVMELSNARRIKESEIELEVQRILESLCETLRPHCDALKLALRYLVQLDLVFARASLSLRYRGNKPEISNDKIFDLYQARHPLLCLKALDSQTPLETIIANDINLDTNRCLIITGPNTGGKTVLLKLIGLCALMVRVGLLLPVKRGSSIGLFDRICADIGDEQSIEQSLSTFSAHMKNIVEIVDTASPRMLILLDEIGSGTDPKEGAALAQAVLESVFAKGAFCVATTHLGELKVLAYKSEGFINASFDFDETNLNPTYKLRLGIPGASRAHTIAYRLGLDKSVVDRSIQLMDQQQLDLSYAIEQVTARLQQLDGEVAEAKQHNFEAEKIKERLAGRERKFNSEIDRLRQEKQNELDSQFGEAIQSIRATIKHLQQNPTIKDAQKAREEVIAFKEALVLPRARKHKAEPESSFVDALEVGMQVKLTVLNQKGTIQEVIMQDKRSGEVQEVVVQSGRMRLKVKPQDLEVIGKGGKSLPYKTPAQNQKIQTVGAKAPLKFDDPDVFVRSNSNTLDLRGKRVEEAQSLLAAFVDTCALNRVSPFMVIHGHGTGAIKSLTREFLKTCPYRLRQRPGETYEGGEGVTVGELSG
jgi:DNA mismatch repair protein MutS2